MALYGPYEHSTTIPVNAVKFQANKVARWRSGNVAQLLYTFATLQLCNSAKGDDTMKRLLMLTMILTLLVAACGDTAVTPETVEPEPTVESDEGIFPRPTVTPDETDTDESYPLPEVATPDTDYPAPEAMPTPDPYPAVEGYVWVVHPFGEQCEEGRHFDDVNAAITALEEADVEVVGGATISLNVCLACGCPTSEHYILQIAEGDWTTAERLGWYLYTDVEG
jgi:hypothetical protein